MCSLCVGKENDVAVPHTEKRQKKVEEKIKSKKKKCPVFIE